MARPPLAPFPLWPFALSGAAAAAAALLHTRWGFPVHEREREVPRVAPPPATPEPEPAHGRPIQHEADGTGPRFHRRYWVDVAESTKTPEALVGLIGEDIQAFAPGEIAVFQKTKGAPDRIAVGDEYEIEIRSPWNGPVRVVESTPTGFTFATLAGHLEAGKIHFEAAAHPTVPGALRFTIESWARSRDAAVDLVYDGLGLAKEAQGAMWTFFCERVVEACGGERMGEVEVETEREATS